MTTVTTNNHQENSYDLTWLKDTVTREAMLLTTVVDAYSKTEALGVENRAVKQGDMAAALARMQKRAFDQALDAYKGRFASARSGNTVEGQSHKATLQRAKQSWENHQGRIARFNDLIEKAYSEAKNSRHLASVASKAGVAVSAADVVSKAMRAETAQEWADVGKSLTQAAASYYGASLFTIFATAAAMAFSLSLSAPATIAGIAVIAVLGALTGEFLAGKAWDIALDWLPDTFNDWRNLNRSGFHYFYDPLVLDLNGNGRIDTLGVDINNRSNNAFFDFDADGLKHATGWLSGDDGFLVRDINGDGIINDGTEVFGDRTRKADGSVAQHGFDALADLDSQGVMGICYS